MSCMPTAIVFGGSKDALVTDGPDSGLGVKAPIIVRSQRWTFVSFGHGLCGHRRQLGMAVNFA